MHIYVCVCVLMETRKEENNATRLRKYILDSPTMQLYFGLQSLRRVVLFNTW